MSGFRRGSSPTPSSMCRSPSCSPPALIECRQQALQLAREEEVGDYPMEVTDVELDSRPDPPGSHAPSDVPMSAGGGQEGDRHMEEGVGLEPRLNPDMVAYSCLDTTKCTININSIGLYV